MLVVDCQPIKKVWAVRFYRCIDDGLGYSLCFFCGSGLFLCISLITHADFCLDIRLCVFNILILNVL